MDGPVLAPRLAELPRAVEGIDDPGAAAALCRAGSLLREHGLAGALLGEPARDQLVREAIALRTQRVGVIVVSADREQEARGLGRDARGEAVVVR